MDEVDWIIRLAERTGHPFTFVSTQVNNAPEMWPKPPTPDEP